VVGAGTSVAEQQLVAVHPPACNEGGNQPAISLPSACNQPAISMHSEQQLVAVHPRCKVACFALLVRVHIRQLVQLRIA
jgi:hypothetical protein